jgi:pimeloyl-ACP methyl ester carboxylesterase
MPLLPKLLTPRRILWFFIRLFGSTAILASAVVFGQNYLVHPLLLSRGATGQGRTHGSLAPGVESFFLTTADSERIEVWHRRVLTNPVSPNTVAIIFHGNGESLESAEPIQEWFSAFGVHSYSFDYRGYGRSSGTPSESGMYRDVESVLGHVTKHEPEGSRFILFGHSLGTGFAAYGTQILPNAAVVLLAPYSSLRAVVEETPVFSLLSSFLWYEIPTTKFLQNGTYRCLLLVHGALDTTIKPENSNRIMGALTGRDDVRSIVDPEGTHNNLLGRQHRSIVEFLDRCLSAAQK